VRRATSGSRAAARARVSALAALAFTAALATGACSSDDGADANADANANAPNAPAGPEQIAFPKGFFWGSATAGFQIEQGLGATDWGAWVRTPGKIKNGDAPDMGGPDALAHVDEDVALLVATHQNAYRFSIELARVYPTRAAFDADQPDPAGLAAYDKVFAALRAAHVTPLVTLQHFVFPDWLSDPSKPSEPQGWERDETVTAFATWCSRAAARWGGEVDWWATINEPMVAPLAGYVQGSFPPGVTLAFDRALLVGKNEARAHARCFDALKAADTVDADGDGKASEVGIVQHQRAVEPEDPSDPEDVAAAARVRYLNNDWILNAVVRGDWDDDFDGSLDGPNDRRGDPSLAGRSDYLGINYYTATSASAHGLKLPVIEASVRNDHLPTDRPKTDFAWDIYPEGMRVVLDEAKGYGLPILVTENGIADASDANRARFVLEHAYQIGLAIADGADVRGYFYWSLLDNFEWATGFCPKFGLNAVDPASKARSARPSAQIYGKLAASGVLARQDIAALPPYAPPGSCD
jgi:beta-glucosidase